MTPKTYAGEAAWQAMHSGSRMKDGEIDALILKYQLERVRQGVRARQGRGPVNDARAWEVFCAVDLAKDDYSSTRKAERDRDVFTDSAGESYLLSDFSGEIAQLVMCAERWKGWMRVAA